TAKKEKKDRRDAIATLYPHENRGSSLFGPVRRHSMSPRPSLPDKAKASHSVKSLFPAACRINKFPGNSFCMGRLGNSFAIGCFAAACGVTSALGVDFASEILPILSDKCFACHGPDSADRKGGLRLDTLEGATADLGGYSAVVAGDLEGSEAIYRITTDDPIFVMPPPESHLVLTKEEIAVLSAWVKGGAEYAEHWAFVAPVKSLVPDESGAKHPIDAFIDKRLAESGMERSAPANPHQLVRRVTLDLTGLPPSPEEAAEFISDFEARGEPAYEALLDRLFASPRYGENMALPWLDAARYADTDGYQFDGPREMWPWRDWVINAYNSGMPFDQFTVEQIAGDLLLDATLDQVIATGFNRNHRYNSEEGLVIEEFLLENAVDRVDTTSTLWMGLTAGCARCHDHKYDPISTREYYQLIAFFNSIPEAGRAIKQGNSEPLIAAPSEAQQKITPSSTWSSSCSKRAPGSASTKGMPTK
ncbi:MAG: DUF1549 domain-containing protein, partial [Myxococcota bacterium]